MKITYTLLLSLFCAAASVFAQDSIVKPAVVGHGTLIGVTPPLRDLPPLTQSEWDEMEAKAHEKLLNPKLRTRTYPYAETALPKGPDGVWQKTMGTNKAMQSDPIVNFQGQTSPYFPPDENGTAGPNHYMQTVNTTYAIYSKTGTLLAGPTNMNLLFGSVPGANCNDGDPIILYDEMADRWMAAEFSLCGSPDRMLVAVSATNDPTGSWYQYSFNMGGMPDYEKFGIWPDGYYMGTNTSNNTDIYVFEREVMLNGGTNPKMVSFDNPWRPGSVDGFMMVPPVDNDGPAAPAGSPGIFIAHQDDAFGGSADQLWIYELDVDWTTTSNSTFTRVQQINVEPFDSNFGNNWNNIKQPGTSQELDAIPQVIMNVPQYRNFGSYQTIICCHTVDVDATDHAGIRWYELRRTSGDWTIRQQGTYAPDEHSRWMGSIMLNGSNELALGYSVSSSSVYPGIRYTGQTAEEYAQASGIMDVPEGIIWEGTASQTGANRWGDYSLLSVDPADDETFWYTNQYVSGGQRTRIASFNIGPLGPNASFIANNTLPCIDETVNFTDISTGGPVSWSWSFLPNTVTFVEGTNSNSQNPRVQFNALGSYSVTLSATNAGGSNAVTQTNYITVNEANAAFSATPQNIVVNNPVQFIDESTCDVTSWDWNFGEGAEPATATGPGPHQVIYVTTGTKTVALTVNGNNTMTRSDYINVIPDSFNMSNITINTCSGTFYDAGGPSQNYGNNLNQTMVFRSAIPGNQLRVEFTGFELESSANCANDYLSVHNGLTPFAPQLGKWCGSDTPGVITSDNGSGALTFVFRSNASGNYPGWMATISCFSPVTAPQTFTATALSDSEIGLEWQKNAENNDVLIAWSEAGIGQPVNGTTYTTGEALPGGGTVLYTGSLNEFTHSGLNAVTTYNYKAFSMTPAMDYSPGLETSATTLNAPPTLAVSPVNIEVDEYQGNASFTVTSNSLWSAVSDAEWCTVTPSGNGNGTIEAVYEANEMTAPRVAAITVTVAGLDPQTVTLTQAGAAPTLNASPLTFQAGAEAGSVQSSVTSNTTWTAVSNQPEWCTVTPAGSGNGTVDIQYTENSWAAVRTATITLTAEGTSPVELILMQDGAEAFLAVEPLALQVSADAGVAEVSIQANFEWIAGSDAGWCTAEPQTGNGTGTLTLNYQENAVTEARTASITITGSSLEQTVTLTQEAAAPSLAVTPLIAEVPYEAGSFDFIITANVDWSAAADSAWLNVTGTGSGNGVLSAVYQTNPNSGSRTSIITVNAAGLDPQQVSVIQDGTGLGIVENGSESIRIYPNPAKDEFIVEVNPADFPEFKVQLLNLTGTEILSKQCSGKEKYVIDISTVRSGSYMIRINSGEKMINHVMVIMK